ncbi:MAG TPA: helix-turn-helix transcriptional regulator [Pyrinomonadaceae bacterium]|jgi:transcriptional regulator with XRE-family HTH domain
MATARLTSQRLGEKLRQVRESLELSQSEMLRHLGFEDVLIYNRISDYELGKREPPLPVLLQYARAAGVCPEVLIDDDLELPARLPSKPKHTHR